MSAKCSEGEVVETTADLPGGEAHRPRIDPQSLRQCRYAERSRLRRPRIRAAWGASRDSCAAASGAARKFVGVSREVYS